jgi:hypothetical protein
LDTNTGSLFVPYIDIDVVHYDDKAPWPIQADGLGSSLERLYANAYGNDPINWRASLAGPSPGRENVPVPAPMQIDSVNWSGGASSGLHLKFSTVPGQTYSIQYSDSLSPSRWFKVADVAAQSSIHLIDFFDPTTPNSSKRFYRIVCPSQP